MSMLHVIRFLYILFPVTDYSPDCKCSLSKVLTDRCLVNKGRKISYPCFIITCVVGLYKIRVGKFSDPYDTSCFMLTA